MICKKCGAELSEDAEFCPVCRSSVNGNEQEEVSAAPTPLPEPVQPAPEELSSEINVDYSAGAAEPVVSDVKKPRKMNLAVSVILAVVFGIITMSVCQTAALLCTVSGALSSHALSEQIAELDIGSIKIGGMIPDIVKEQFDNVSVNISDDISAIISKFSDGAMNADQAAEIIKKSGVSKEIAKIVRSYEDYMMSGRSDLDVSKELERIILGAKQVYKDVTGREVPSDFDSDVTAALKENAEALQQAAPQAALGMIGDTLQVVFSPLMWIAAFVLSALFPALVGLITRRVPAALMCGGVAYFVSGTGILISNALTGAFIKAFGFDEFDNVLMQIFSNALDGRLMVCGAVLAAVGAALVAVFIIVKVSASRKSKIA